jgi:hypothetical protein
MMIPILLRILFLFLLLPQGLLHLWLFLGLGLLWFFVALSEFVSSLLV